MAAPSASDPPPAALGPRMAAYLIDSVVLLVLQLVFFVIAGAVLLLTSDWGRNDPPDAAFSAFIAILIGGPTVCWSILNLAMDRWRAQSIGMYVAGVQAVPKGRPPNLIFLRWFGLNPVLYHPLFLPILGLLSAYATSLTLSRAVLVITLTVAFLCVAAPVAGLAAMAFDGERRGIHDRLGRTRVVVADGS